MAMTERYAVARVYEEAQSFEQRRLRVLDGSAAREKMNARRADVVKISLTVMAILVYFLGVTMMEAKIGTMGGKINTLQREIESRENESLRADMTIGDLSSLERIENYAVTCLGMVRPGMDNIHYLNSESSLVIANSLQTESEGEDISAVDAEEPNFLESVFAAITNYWNGQALATGFEAE